MASVAGTARTLAGLDLRDLPLVSPSPYEPEFRELGNAVRRDLLRIADDVERRGDSKQTLGRLGIALQTCVACHQTFQLDPVVAAPARQRSMEQAVIAGERDMTAPPDRRVALLARPNERAYLLRGMRTYLAGLQTILVALSQDDWGTVGETARAMATLDIQQLSLVSAAKYDVAFRDLALELQRDLEAIGQGARERNLAETLGRMGAAMGRCLTCHQTYRLGDAVSSRAPPPGR